MFGVNRDCLAADSDKSAENAALIRAHHDAMNRDDWKNASTYYAEDTKDFGTPGGRQRVRMVYEDIWTTFPDFRLDIIDLVAKDDVVVVRCRESGTYLGVQKRSVNGGLLIGVPPTHKHFEVGVMHWYKIRDGKIVDHYGAWSSLGYWLSHNLNLRKRYSFAAVVIAISILKISESILW
jgi:predicted ester cyclase